MINGSSPWWLPGAALIFFGVMIVLFPELLAFMVASALIFTGISLLVLGRAFTRARKPAQSNVIYNERTWQ